jgi:hypothetical protein
MLFDTEDRPPTGLPAPAGEALLHHIPKRYDVLAGIELAPALCRLLLAWESGILVARHALGELPALTWIAAATRHLFRVVLRAQPLNMLRSSSYAAGVESPARPKPKSMLSTRNVLVPSSAKPAAHGPLRKTASRSERAFWSVAATCHGLHRRIPSRVLIALIASLNSRMPLPSARPGCGKTLTRRSIAARPLGSRCALA